MLIIEEKQMNMLKWEVFGGVIMSPGRVTAFSSAG
jgi:hypothetical protein